MSKKLHFKSLLLLATMLFGASSAWADEVTYDFTKIEGFSEWGTSYVEHSVDYTEAVVTFASADKNGQTITDQPVTKGQPVSIVMKDANIISKASFTCTQWGTKAQTITLNYSTDGGKTYKSTGVTSSNFTISSDDLPSGTNAVQITFSSSSNQVGIASATITYEEGEVTPTCAAPTFSIESGTYASTQNVEISTTTEGATIYYTLDGTDPTDNSTEYEEAIEVSDDATIKAIAYLGSVVSNISEISITIGTAVTFTLNDKDAIEALGITLPEAGQGTKVELIEKDGISIAATTAEGKTDTRIYQGSGNNEGKYDFRIYAGGTLTFTAGSSYIKKIEFTGNNLSNLSGNNYSTGTWTGSAQSVTLTATGTATIYTITVTIGNPPAIEAPVSSVQTGTYYETQSVELTCTTEGTEIYYTIDGSDPTKESTKYFGAIEVSETTIIKALAATSDGVSAIMEVTITIPEPVTVTLQQEMETFCSASALDFSKSGLKVYTVQVNEDGVAVLTEVTSGQVPGSRGVILMGTPGNYEAMPIESAAAFENNELYGRTTDGKVSYEYNGKYCYILQGGVFKKATGEKIKGGKAYLNTTYDITAAGARELKIVFAGEATGIKAIETATDKNVYDLQGRKVAAPQKGLYIINGKKMIVK